MVFEPKKRLIKHTENKRLCTLVFDGTLKYYRNCIDIHKNKELEIFDINNINFLDFKLTKNCFKNLKYEDLLWKYLNFGENDKVLHVVNDRIRTLMISEEWFIFCDLINQFSILNSIQLELHIQDHNYFEKEEQVSKNLELLKKCSIDKFSIVDLHIIVSNKEAYYINVKCDNECFLNNPSMIKYDPKADRPRYRNRTK